MGTRETNERKFGNWETLPGGGRRYWYEVLGRTRWRARYVKEVDVYERTLSFWQEIYNERGQVVERHLKFPEDRGHKKVHNE